MGSKLSKIPIFFLCTICFLVYQIVIRQKCYWWIFITLLSSDRYMNSWNYYFCPIAQFESSVLWGREPTLLYSVTQCVQIILRVLSFFMHLHFHNFLLQLAFQSWNFFNGGSKFVKSGLILTENYYDICQ